MPMRIPMPFDEYCSPLQRQIPLLASIKHGENGWVEDLSNARRIHVYSNRHGLCLTFLSGYGFVMVKASILTFGFMDRVRSILIHIAAHLRYFIGVLSRIKRIRGDDFKAG